MFLLYGIVMRNTDGEKKPRKAVGVAKESGWLVREKVERLIESRNVTLRTQYAPV